MKQQDVQQLAKYSDKYIAFVGDILHVIASGTTMTEVTNILKEQNITKATITYIPPVDKAFSPLCQ
jgi:hypoxanthine-guanine phosphoribosyltransferase